MKILFHDPAQADWPGRFGRTRQEIAAKLLENRVWPELPGHAVHISEPAPLALTFELAYPHEGGHLDDLERPRFTVIFDYQESRADMRLKNILFEPLRYKGGGSRLLGNAVRLALELDVARIHAEPTMQGAWFWPRRGALIQAMPNDARQHLLSGLPWLSERGNIGFMERVESLIESPDCCLNWQPEATAMLHRLTGGDPMEINRMAVRDDLFVKPRWGDRMPLHRYLLTDIMLGPCIFDLNHPWTKACLRQRLALDVDATREALRPARPVSSAGTPHPAPHAE